ncbi:putative metallo-beta-lactamase superfamily hydrolase [Mycobacterium sp. URHB0021]
MPGSVAAATAVRVAISHHLVRSDYHGEFLDQLRHAARVKHHPPGRTP